ncbi:A-kinase anchor protein 7 [Lingula anatina]|uniref:A-kinase anchor protein 7 n=1 Tax=Lingula anatina TaxID=7574 RepID=A0A1S3IFS7_LINAN|nr:A-kinase anchor protein 7 [Lingula anatina]|eukprot:XP_013397003.1 A-kinase anchor protein 7 [Lingula anatina]
MHQHEEHEKCGQCVRHKQCAKPTFTPRYLLKRQAVSGSSDGGAGTASASKGSGEIPQQQPKPTHFVCIQMNNKKLQESLMKVEDDIVEKYKSNCKVDLSSIVKSPSAYHITLMAAKIENDKVLERAKEALDNCYETQLMKFENDPLTVKMQGIDDFSGEIVFAKVKPTPEKGILGEISKAVRATFKQASVKPFEDRPFIPHITILHLYPHMKYELGLRKIDPKCYEPYREMYFGQKKITSVQLCKMGRPKHEPYYEIAHEVFF